MSTNKFLKSIYCNDLKILAEDVDSVEQEETKTNKVRYSKSQARQRYKKGKM